ncbi:glycoside hydrolase family 18 protein [Xylariales sp. PMI_506]|nr:glycoside hydrolase family 18 protein [Xylariales sp. PMI_506]
MLFFNKEKLRIGAFCTSLLVASGLAEASNHRVAIYYQTVDLDSSNSSHISLLPLIDQDVETNISVTHVFISSFHIQDNATIHLNDLPPENQRFNEIWSDAAELQRAGVIVGGMLGGSAVGSYTLLDGDATSFEKYYAPLKSTIATYGLQAMDLDVEEAMSLSGIVRLIARLKADFGSDFVITLAPVAAALRKENGGSLGGFSYFDLEAVAAENISFYNAQFYDNWGDASSTSDYQNIIESGWAPDRVNMGILTNAAEGSGFVTIANQTQVLEELIAMYPTFGGVSGWEYYNSQPGGEDAPWEWAAKMATAMNNDDGAAVNTTSLEVKRKRTSHTVSNVIRGRVKSFTTL